MGRGRPNTVRLDDPKALNVEWAGSPDCGFDVSPDWSRLLLWFAPGLCSTRIMSSNGVRTKLGV
jgi:hypothetical protein